MKWMVFQQIIPNNKIFFNNLIKEKKIISLIFNPHFWPRDNHKKIYNTSLYDELLNNKDENVHRYAQAS